MKNLAPNIIRQRLLIEATYNRELTEKDVKKYLIDISKNLSLRTYGDPIIHSPSGTGKKENQGYDAFIPLIDSGISIYIWTNSQFLSVVLYTCKQFSIEDALIFTKEFFSTTELEHTEF